MIFSVKTSCSSINKIPAIRVGHIFMETGVLLLATNGNALYPNSFQPVSHPRENPKQLETSKSLHHPETWQVRLLRRE
jgi:hypothetical protein